MFNVFKIKVITNLTNKCKKSQKDYFHRRRNKVQETSNRHRRPYNPNMYLEEESFEGAPGGS